MRVLHGAATTFVRTSYAAALAGALRVADVSARVTTNGGLLAVTDDMRLIGDVALRHGYPI